MAQIRQKDTDIEILVGAALRSFGVNYRKNVKKLPGSPDFANRKRKWAIFVHGCFWHHHPGCKKATIPKSNSIFWKNKFQDNRRRDRRVAKLLRQDGFQVTTIWGCEEHKIRSKLCKIFKSSGIQP